MFILKGALTDANFHSTSKKVDKLFPKAKNAKYFGKRDWEDSLEDKGVDIATMAKWDWHDIIDAIGFFVSMYVGRPLGSKIEALKNESFKKSLQKRIYKHFYLTNNYISKKIDRYRDELI